MSHKKFGPDRFSRFDVYWIQTDKPNLYIEDDKKNVSCNFFPHFPRIAVFGKEKERKEKSCTETGLF